NALKPQVVVVQAGINDLTAIGVFPWWRDALVAHCKANLRQIVRRCNDGGAVVVVTTIFPTGSLPLDRLATSSDQIPAAVEEVNRDLRAMKSDRVLVLDAYAILQDGGRTRPKY